MTRFTPITVVLLAVSLAAQDGSDLKTNIDRLSAFDYAARTGAARAIRRVPAPEAVPALSEAVGNHRDSFVRYRALVLLTAFNDPRTTDLMRSLARDSNDRLREVVYRWFELHPDPAIVPMLTTALGTEQAEFVRPALIRALAASSGDVQVQRALLTEAGRGFDFFRTAVIEALGDNRASFAAATLAEIAKLEGPLQDDAVLALGRIGGPQAAETLKALANPSSDILPSLHAARCLIEGGCEEHLRALADIARSVTTKPETMRAAVWAIGAVAARGDAAAASTLVTLASSGSAAVRKSATSMFAGLALKRSSFVIEWLAATPEVERARAIDTLYEGFDSLEEDFAEEQFFATARAAYWQGAVGSADRTVMATLIDKLEF